jgi:hypothetical protein
MDRRFGTSANAIAKRARDAELLIHGHHQTLEEVM